MFHMTGATAPAIGGAVRSVSEACSAGALSGLCGARSGMLEPRHHPLRRRATRADSRRGIERRSNAARTVSESVRPSFAICPASGADHDAGLFSRKVSMVVSRAVCLRRGRRSICSMRRRSLRLGLCAGSTATGLETWSSSCTGTSRAAAKAGGPVMRIAESRKSCAPFIAFFAMSGRCDKIVA